ncbi:hypothetical protein QQF64_009178 [Cirrhinus molitorella]|uniref:Fibronectin type-III domain-containing protein n=1 Tax=Cirrhinus molitorella TaxID=172907 RepID=A0ABR3M2V1_9TELE
MWLLKVAIFLLCCAGCWGQSCNRTKAYFKSRNFFSVLHWDPVDIPGQTVLYSVQCSLYGNPYKPVTWCQNISTAVCDMTDAMIHVTSDVTSKYRVKVSAGGQCLGEVTFSPFWETTFEAPQLSVTSNQTHLNVTVLPPMAAWNHSIANFRFWGKGSIRSSIKYTVHLTQPESLAGKVFEDSSRSVIIWVTKLDVQYCGEVFYTLTHPGPTRPSENAPFCLNVSESRSWLHIIIWPCLLALLLLIILPIRLCQLSVKRKRPPPKSLDLTKYNSPAFCAERPDSISKVEVWSGFDPKFEPQAVFPPQKSEVVFNDGYASQDHCDLELACDQPDIPVPDSAESSVHYSMILPVKISNEPSFDGTTDETNSDSFGPDSISTFLIGHLEAESSSGPLVIPVRPAENGTLQFNNCLFLCNSGQSSPAPTQDSEGLTGEGIPLLSDHSLNDSWCNSSCLPVHVPEVVTSSYRQNWVPGIPLEGQQDQRTYIKRTDPTEPDKDFNDEEEARVGVVFLERWKVKMQGLSLSCN